MMSRRQFGTLTLAAAAAMASQKTAAQSPKRRIVDAQVHLWKAESEDWKWVPGMKPQMPEPFTVEKLMPLMDQAGVDRVVVVPPSWPGDRNDYAPRSGQALSRSPRGDGARPSEESASRGTAAEVEGAARHARHTGDIPRPGPDVVGGRHARTGSGRRPKRPACR